MESNSALTKILSEIVEARRIWAAIDSAQPKASLGAHSVLFTSAAREEGKTLLCSGMAMIAAGRNRAHVLAIDLNWFRPALHRQFGVEQCFTLEALRSGEPLASMVRPSGMANLDILPAPRMDDGSMKSSLHDLELGAALIQKAQAAYDMVLVDASAVFPANRNMMDPVSLGRLVDGVVLVVLGSVTPRQEVKRARAVLENAGARISGAILNQWRNPITR